MNQLIKITEKEGKQVVSARELYLGLGLNKSNWSRWYPKNIELNGYFNEGYDYIGVRHNDEGNEIQDFAISLEFAKHIAMMARTEKSHQYRNYFIQCENKLIENVQAPKQLTALEQLQLQNQAILEVNDKVDGLDSRIEGLENRMTIETGKQNVLRILVNKKVSAILGGKDSPAYKELNKKAFSKCWNDFKSIMQVSSYKDTPIKDFELAQKVIIDWQPNRELELMIKWYNARIRM